MGANEANIHEEYDFPVRPFACLRHSWSASDIQIGTLQRRTCGYIIDGWNRSGDETQHLLTSTPDAVSF